MTSQGCRLAAVLALLAAAVPPLSAGADGFQATGAQRIQVCALVSKEEVKKHLPWMAALDQMPIEEEPIGATGSSCGYPTVHVQVLPFTKSFLDAARETAPLEPVPGVGDEAYFRNNRNRFAELFVRVGPRLLTLQADADGPAEMADVKPRVIALAKVYVPKLR